MLVTLDTSIDELNATALRQQLAVAYGIDAQSISLKVNGGSLLVELTVLSGVGGALSATSILTLLSALNDTQLSSALKMDVTLGGPVVVDQTLNVTSTTSSTLGYYLPEGAVAPVPCPQGTHSDPSVDIMTSESQCIDCGIGTYCALGSTVATDCSAGTYNDLRKQASCMKCSAGTFQDWEGSTACKVCERGSYCHKGAAAPLPCAQGSFSSRTDLTAASECTMAAAGYFAPTGSVDQMPCAAGSFASAAGEGACTPCPAGSFQREAGATQCSVCIKGSYCPEGASAPLPCEAGSYSDATKHVLTSAADCIVCGPGSFCPVGSSAPTLCSPGLFNDAERQSVCRRCPSGAFQSEIGGTTCRACTRGFYCPEATSVPLPCPSGTYGASNGLHNRSQCTTTPQGFFSGIGSTTPERCPMGSFASSSGQASCAPCIPGTYANSTGSIMCPMCAPGHWCSADMQIPCSENTYNPHPSVHLITNCTRCPERTSTHGQSGVVSRELCLCSPENYLAPDGFPLGPECRDRCCTCPVGTDCSEGAIALANLPVNPGYFRRFDDQIDVRRCPDAAANCPSGQTTCQNSTSGCAGGRDIETICRPGLKGVFCRQCNDPAHYYLSAERGTYAQCLPCEAAVSNGLSSVLGVVGVTLTVNVIVGGLLVYLCRHNLKRLRAVWLAVHDLYKVPNKLKILVGFYMIATKIETVYEIYLPADVRKVLASLRIVISFGIEGVPLACIGAEGYIQQLLFWVCAPLLPLGLVALALLAIMVRNIVSHRCLMNAATNEPSIRDPKDDSNDVTARRILQKLQRVSLSMVYKRTTPLLLRLYFVIYPIVTNVACEAFSCFRFLDGSAFLIADVSIQCDTKEHANAKALAVVAIIIYPVGLFLVNATFLYSARRAILSKRPTSLSRVCAFLHREYQHEDRDQTRVCLSLSLLSSEGPA